jgi:hypothetical protein
MSDTTNLYYYNIEYIINGQYPQSESEIGANFSGIIYNEGNAIVDIYIYKEEQLGDALIPGQVMTFSLQPYQFLRIKGVYIEKVKFIFDQNNNSNNNSIIKIKGVLSFLQEGEGSIDLEGTYVNAQIINSYSNPVPVVNQSNASILGSIINGSISANTNFFSSNLAIQQPSRVKIVILPASSGTLSLILNSGSSTVSGNFNAGAQLNAGSWFEFEIDLPPGVSINLQYSASTTVTVFVIATPLG